MQGTQGNDTLIGLNEIDDDIDGLAGDDWIEGGDESVPWGDFLRGGTGNDTSRRGGQRPALPRLVLLRRE